MKLKITNTERKYFMMDNEYHYYEPKVYSLNMYFAGFNLRQLKRVMYIFSQISLSYTYYHHLIQGRWRDGLHISEDELHTYETFKECIGLVNEIVNEMKKFKNNGDTGYGLETFGEQFEKELHGRVWVKPCEELEGVKFAKYGDDDKYRTGGTTEYHRPEADNVSSVGQNMGCYFRWFHWLVYFKEALFENGPEPGDGSDDLDLTLVVELEKKSKILLSDFNKIGYIKFGFND